MTRAALRVAALLCLTACAASVRADVGLAAAVRTDDPDAVRAALAAGADVDAPSMQLRPLTIAAIRGELEIVDLLLAAGADSDAISLGRGNALSMAVRSCRADLDIIAALVAGGVPASRTDPALASRRCCSRFRRSASMSPCGCSMPAPM